MSDHTPEPWSVDPKPGGSGALFVEHHEGASVYTLIATVHSEGGKPQEANAHLIAAAPNMLKRIAELESQLVSWDELWRAINEMKGGGLREDNKPLAIAASYALLKERAESVESQLAEARRDALEEAAKVCEKRIEPRTTGIVDEERDAEAQACAKAIRAMQAEPPAHDRCNLSKGARVAY